MLTYEVTLLELARAYLLLADPGGPAADWTASGVGAGSARVRDAMMGAPDMVGGTYDSLDTELMRRRPGHLLAKAGADGMRAMGLVAACGRGGFRHRHQDRGWRHVPSRHHGHVGGGAGPDRRAR